jgi:hypothetical protein
MSLVAFCGQEKKQLPSDEFQNGEIAWTYQRRFTMELKQRFCSSLQCKELLPNVVFSENFSGDDFGTSCRGFGG